MSLETILSNNTPLLFNHGPQGYPFDAMAMAGGIEHIPARALCLSRPGDVVQIHPDLRGEAVYILEHYRQLGINCSTTLIADTSYEVAKQFPAHKLDVFLFSDAAHAARENSRRHSAAQRLNHKNWFVGWCLRNGYPTPDVECYPAGTIPNSTQLMLPVFVKAAVSGSGAHVVKCTTWPEVLAAVSLMPGDYQLQQAIAENHASLNVLYFARDGHAQHIATTQQILSQGTSHQGNHFPAKTNPRKVTDAAAQAAAELGIEGFFAFDVMSASRASRWAAPNSCNLSWFIECNPRPNGSAYYTVAAHRLGNPAQWTGRNIRTRFTSLADIDLGDLVYSPGRGYGVAIVGWGSILFGVLGLLIIGNTKQQTCLHAAVTELLS